MPHASLAFLRPSIPTHFPYTTLFRSFSTRIAYVVKRGSRFELQIADADGADEEAALVSFEPIISPAWSPDGRRDDRDRKSTRLNSSHTVISYAVFCLKKKTRYAQSQN